MIPGKSLLAYSSEGGFAVIKLTTAQDRAMQKLRERGTSWSSSYTLGVSRNTLDALHRRGLIDRVAEPGAEFAPCTNIKYRRKFRRVRSRVSKRVRA